MIDEKRLIKDCEKRLLVGTNAIKMIEEQPKISEWIPIAEKLPEPGEYILLSFENFTMADIGRYEKDEDGSGAFYPGDEDESYASIGLFVNAWMPLPEPYKESEDTRSLTFWRNKVLYDFMKRVER
jgi:hypothetical protein